MGIAVKQDERTVSDLAKALVALELQMTNDAAGEYRRLMLQHHVCIELTVRCAWTEAGPLIDAEVARLRKEFQPAAMR